MGYVVQVKAWSQVLMSRSFVKFVVVGGSRHAVVTPLFAFLFLLKRVQLLRRRCTTGWSLWADSKLGELNPSVGGGFFGSLGSSERSVSKLLGEVAEGGVRFWCGRKTEMIISREFEELSSLGSHQQGRCEHTHVAHQRAGN